MIVELEITDPSGVNNRGARLAKGDRIKLDQHDGRARAWLRFGQAKIAEAEKAAAEPEAPAPAPAVSEPQQDQPKAHARKRGGGK